MTTTDPDAPPMLTLHGGATRSDKGLQSSPVPIPRGQGRQIIELAVSDIEELDAQQVAEIEDVSIGLRGKQLNKLPDALWDFPSLSRLSVHTDRLCDDLFARGVPPSVTALAIYAQTRDLGDVAPAPNLQELTIGEPHSFLFAPPGTFPNLRTARIQMGQARQAKDRARMWEQVAAWAGLTELEINHPSDALSFADLPRSIATLILTRGTYASLDLLEGAPDLRSMTLLPSTKLRSLDGLEKLQTLEEFDCLNAGRLDECEALLALPKLRRVMAIRPPKSTAPVFRALRDRGTELVGFRDEDSYFS